MAAGRRGKTQARLGAGRQCQPRRQHAHGIEAGGEARGETVREAGLTTSSPPASIPCVLAARLTLAPGAKARLCFATAASSHAATLQAVIDKYRQPVHIDRALLMSATLAGIGLRAWHMGADTYTTLQSLTTALMMTLTRCPGHSGGRCGV